MKFAEWIRIASVKLYCQATNELMNIAHLTGPKFIIFFFQLTDHGNNVIFTVRGHPVLHLETGWGISCYI